MNKGTCRSCGAPVYWVLTAASGNKKAMPVNRKEIYIFSDEANKKKSIVTQYGEVFSGCPANKGHSAAIMGYESHFSTCPNADKHRRK